MLCLATTTIPPLLLLPFKPNHPEKDQAQTQAIPRRMDGVKERRNYFKSCKVVSHTKGYAA